MTRRSVPVALLLRLILAIVLDTAVQILWKLAVTRSAAPESIAAAAAAALHEPLFVLVLGLFLWQLVNWLRVLEASDLSYAQPITSLSFVSVFALSAIYLGESVDAAKIFGIALVFAGVWFISRTDHDSNAPNAAGGSTLHAAGGSTPNAAGGATP